MTLYSDDEGTAAHHRELSQKDFNDTKSEQLMIQHQNRMLAKKVFTRNLLTTPQNDSNNLSEALQAQRTEKNAER